MPGRRRHPAIPLAAAVIVAMVMSVLATACGSAAPAAGNGPVAVKGFDEAGVSTGLGDNFTASDWNTIRRDGFRLFITDPVDWSSECSGGGCSHPVHACTVNPAAVSQLQHAYREGIDYAVYTRNVNCLTTAIKRLPAVLRAHLSFALLDIEAGPSVPLTGTLISSVRALGQTPVVYSFPSAWQSVMHGSSDFSGYPLQDGEVTGSGGGFPASYPAGYPAIGTMPVPYGGWSGHDARIEQVRTGTDIRGPAGAIDNPADPIELDAVSAAWLASLPQHA